ncbi:hypothetical protein BDP27DRAFT_1359720 [Rhodocollybia butyracea]|uniref:Uncharacterized protein n=1 Tax=Rhodocollybia butyracea TaxID=206335 RepID=A0A9P5Q509_9AGAR|nr:hypothetical protein BDP27DRAFT_1359720 [Rhodocollybia butyracea]
MITPKCGASESCSLTVDVVLQSSDGEQLGAHSKNLELYSDAFPIAGSTIPPDGDIVKLTENAQILQLMLCFTHNMPPPDFSSLNIQTLFAFGETVNLKYNMYYAIKEQPVTRALCKFLAYKTKVSDLSMIDDVARRTMNIPLENVVGVLVNLETFRTWVRYREKWQSMLVQYRQAFNQYSQSYRGNPGPIRDNLTQTSDHIGLPSRTTAQCTIAVHTQANAKSGFVLTSAEKSAKQSAAERVYEVVDQLPLWKDYL